MLNSSIFFPLPNVVQKTYILQVLNYWAPRTGKVWVDLVQIHRSLRTIINWLSGPQHKGLLWDWIGPDTIPRCWMHSAARSTCSNSLASYSKPHKTQQHLPSMARASVNLYSVPSSCCLLQRAKHWLQKLRMALSVEEQKGLWIPSSDNSEFCNAPVCSQQMGHYLWREPRTKELARCNMAAQVGILLGDKAIVRESITASVSWKIHPDETSAHALPNGAQTQRETNKNKIEADLGLTWWDLQTEWRHYSITVIPQSSIRAEHVTVDSAGRVVIMGQIFPLAYLGNDSISAFAYSCQAWKRDSKKKKKSACERNMGIITKISRRQKPGLTHSQADKQR